MLKTLVTNPNRYFKETNNPHSPYSLSSTNTCTDDTSDKGDMSSFKNRKSKIRQPSTNSRATRIKTSKQENT